MSLIEFGFGKRAISENWDYLNNRFLSREDRGRNFILPPKFIDIHLGYKGSPCQNRCLWCYDQGESNKSRFGPSQIETLRSELDRIIDWQEEELQVEQIYLAGGGEPTLFPEIASLIIDRFSETGKTVWLTTNGIFFSSRLLQSVPNLEGVLISLNGSDRESYRLCSQNDAFDKVMENAQTLLTLRKLAGKDFKVIVTFVFHPLNIQNLEDLILTLNDMGIDEFRCRYNIFSAPTEEQNVKGKAILEDVQIKYPDLPMKIFLKSPPTERLPSEYECYSPFIWPTWNPLHGVFPCAHNTDADSRISARISDGIHLLTEIQDNLDRTTHPICHRRCPSRIHWFNLFLNGDDVFTADFFQTSIMVKN